MRIACEVAIESRLSVHLNVNQKCKPCQASVSLGKKANADNELYFMVSTARNRNGQKYKIKNNIENIFFKYASEGKFSIQFKNPPHDVAVKKADPILLKSFINILKHNDFKGKHIPLLVPATAAQVTKPRQKLQITRRTQYPSSGQSFPQSLEHLSVNSCSLKRIETRILQLRNLSSLDLSDNNLTEIPQDLGKNNLKRLTVLVLAHNKLSSLPVEFFSNFENTLVKLDLSHNLLEIIPDEISSMKRLHTFQCSHNQLNSLPRNMGTLPELKILIASNNQFTTIPSSMRKLRLDRFDLCLNNFPTKETVANNPNPRKFGVPSLRECAASSITKNNVKYTSSDLPRCLLRYMKTVKWCHCGNPCFENHQSFTINFDLRRISNVIVMHINTDTIVPMEMIACSPKCLKFK